MVVPAKAGTQFLAVNPSEQTLRHAVIGVSSNLTDCIEAHRKGCVDGFTKQYGVHTLVYFEVHAGIYEAI